MVKDFVACNEVRKDILERGYPRNLPAPLDIQWPKCFWLQGASPRDPLTRGSAPGPRWGLCPQTSVIGWCSALAMVSPNHWPFLPPMPSPGKNPVGAPVCLCVCPRSYLRNYTSDLHQFLCMLPMAVARSSGGVMVRYVLPVMDDVMFAHKPRLMNVAPRWSALGLAIYCAQ